MINVILTGVGGQGTVLAAKVLAQAAQAKGWKVRTAETIGMAQRGGSVVSHVRMGNAGSLNAVSEPVFSSLISLHTADLIIAFEPAEALRCLEYLSPQGVVVTASTQVTPTTAALSGATYQGSKMLEYLQNTLEPARLHIVDDALACERLGTRKVLNTVLLSAALATDCLPLTADDLRQAIRACVRRKFLDLNLAAIT